MKKLARLLGAVLVLGLLFCGTAFAGISSDVKIDVTSVDLVSLVEHGIKTDTRITEEKLSSDNTGVGNEFEISFDVTFKEGVTPYLQLNFASTDHKASVDIISSDKTDGVKIMATIAGKTSNDVSFDVSKASKDILLTVNISDDTNSGDVIVRVVISASVIPSAPAFDSATFTLEVDEDSAGGIDPETYEATSDDEEFSESFTASTDVSEITITIDSESEVLGFSVDGDWEVASGEDDNTKLTLTVSGDALTETLHVYMASGDTSNEANSIDIALTFTLDDNNEAGDTYVLDVSDITLTTKYSTSDDTYTVAAKTGLYTTDEPSDTIDVGSELDSTASADWGSAGTITVSEDYIGGSFSITVTTDATIVAVYAQDAEAGEWATVSEYSDNVFTPDTYGTYKFVLSADLVAATTESDASATKVKAAADDEANAGYFAFNVIIASVDESSKGDETKTVSPADAPTTTDANGNKVLDENSDPVANSRFSNGTTASSALINQFFASTTTALSKLDDDEITALLKSIGYTADDLGDETTGYKAIAFKLPVKLVSGDPYFALLADNDNGTGTKTYLGFGYIPKNLDGKDTMVILFKLLRNPNNPKEFMSFSAGEYFVGATNDGTSSTGSNTRALFMTADGETFNIKSNKATLLQGQTTSGTPEPYAETPSDVTNEVSSHGSSSGCDAGFGALALLAVAGALAARKVRK